MLDSGMRRRLANQKAARAADEALAETALRENPFAAITTIAAELGISPTLVSATRKRLVKQREIHKVDPYRKSDPLEPGHARDCWCGWGLDPETYGPDHDDDEPPILAKPWAVITWHGSARAGKASYYRTQTEAEAEAPADKPFTIINVATKPKPSEDMDALIRQLHRTHDEGTA